MWLEREDVNARGEHQRFINPKRPDHAELWLVGEVLSNAREVDNGLDPGCNELFRVAYTRKLENVRRPK